MTFTIHDTKNTANCRLLSEILEAAQNSNFAGIKEANIAANARQMLAALRLVLPEIANGVKTGHFHPSLLKRVENSISLAETGRETHKELSNGTYLQSSPASHP